VNRKKRRSDQPALPAFDDVAPIVPPSREVIEHHARQHGCPGAPAVVTRCAHNSTLLIQCGKCGQVMFIAVAPGTWCSDAAKLVSRHG
jgi:hypothetical protein